MDKNKQEVLVKQNSISERNFGIDALRLLSMFFVVILHTMLHGGVLNNTIGIKNDISWLFEIIVWCAVDIYGLISGYVGYSDAEKPVLMSRYISMWVQVFFYSFGITVLFAVFKPGSVSSKMMIEAFFPVSTKQYWYFSAFTALYLIRRWLNSFIRKLTCSEYNCFVALLIGVFSIYYMFANRLGGDPFSFYSGASFLWLIVLYFLGAWIKKCNIANKINTIKGWIAILICTVITWTTKQFLPDIISGGVLVSNMSPTILCSAMAYLLIFSKMKISNTISKIIAFFAPAAFGVYIIHEHRLVRASFISDAFTWVANVSLWEMLFEVLGFSIFVFVVCLTIERIRLFLFKVFKIDIFITKIGKQVDRVIMLIERKVSRI